MVSSRQTALAGADFDTWLSTLQVRWSPAQIEVVRHAYALGGEPELAVADLLAGATEAVPTGAPVELVGPVNYDGFYTAALALALDREGYDVRVPDDQLYIFTDAMRAPREWTPTRLLVQFTKGGLVAPQPGARLLAQSPIGDMIFVEADRISLWEAPPAAATESASPEPTP